MRYLSFPSTFNFIIYCTLIAINDNPIIIEGDSKGSVSSSSLRRGLESQSHSLSSINRDFKSEIIPLIGDLEMEGMYEESLPNEAPYRDSSETLFPQKPDWVESLVEKLMYPPVLSRAQIEVSHQRREIVSSLSQNIIRCD